METTAPVRVVVVHGHGGQGPLSAECARRLRRAIRIEADATILSGADEAIAMFRVWESLGGSSEGLWLDSLSRSTIENVHYASLMAGCLDATEVVVVSSWWHIPRVRMCWAGAELPVSYRRSWGHIRYVPREFCALLRYIKEHRPFAEEPYERVRLPN